MADIPVNASDANTIAVVTVDGQTSFDYDFRADFVDDMKATLTKLDGSTVDFVGGVDFVASGLGTATGGTITLATYVDAVETEEIVIYRDIEIDRTTDYTRDVFAIDLNSEQDRIFMIMQELRRDVDRSVKTGIGKDTVSIGQGTVGQIPVFNDDGDLVPGNPAGTGDMRSEAYDPQGITGDAFARGNHTGTQGAQTIVGPQPLTLQRREDVTAGQQISLGKGRLASGPLENDIIAQYGSQSILDAVTWFTSALLRSVATENHDLTKRGFMAVLSHVARNSTAVRDILQADERGFRAFASGSTYEHLVTMPEAWGVSTANAAATNDAAITEMLARINTTKRIDGGGQVYPVTALPDLTRFKSIGFKVGSVIHTSKDFFRNVRTRKITHGMKYTAWAQDKAYMVGKQIRVWVLEKESHPDGTGRIVLYVSDDNGSTFWPGEYLQVEAKGETLWSAGFDPATGNEYLLVRVPAGTTDVPPYTYTLWKRTLTLGAGTGNYYAPFTKTPITFPVPGGMTGQPVMVHSFTVGHGGSIVVGASYGEGACVMRSTDSGVNWTGFVIGVDGDLEEPTVSYDPTTQRYYGFCRNGGTGNPVYWHSAVNDLSAISRYTAPAGTFGANALTDAPVPLKIYNGRIYAFSAFRNGTLEGSGDDELTSAFFFDLPVFAGNIWSQVTAKIFRIGTIPHREGSAGASACGQGSVVMVGNRVHLYFGMEERTGTTAERNRIANIYQVSIPLTEYEGSFDFRDDLADNGAYLGPLMKMPENRGWAIYTDDASDNYPARVGGRPNFAPYRTTISIAAGVITITPNHGEYIIDTEGGAAADDLDKINVAGHMVGDVIALRTASSGRDITVKHNAIAGAEGAIYLDGLADKVLSNGLDEIYLKLTLVGSTLSWKQVSFSNLGT